MPVSPTPARHVGQRAPHQSCQLQAPISAPHPTVAKLSLVKQRVKGGLQGRIGEEGGQAPHLRASSPPAFITNSLDNKVESPFGTTENFVTGHRASSPPHLPCLYLDFRHGISFILKFKADEGTSLSRLAKQSRSAGLRQSGNLLRL